MIGNEIVLIVPTIVNVLSMFGIIGVCLFELNSSCTKGKPLRRAQYIILLIGAMLSGFQPMLWATIPSLGTALLSSSLLIFLIIHSVKRNKV